LFLRKKLKGLQSFRPKDIKLGQRAGTAKKRGHAGCSEQSMGRQERQYVVACTLAIL
jgi:hypothetical protein